MAAAAASDSKWEPATSGPEAKPWESAEWKALQAHVEEIRPTHLKQLLQDESRCAALTAEFDGILLDYSRQRVTADTMTKLFALAEATGLTRKMAAMACGAHINVTEDRAVMHTALRAPHDAVVNVDGVNVMPEVHLVRQRIRDFAERVRTGAWVGATGKQLKHVVSIGIGGSYLGPEFVFEAMRHDPECHKAAAGRTLRFLANVDPTDVARAIDGLDPESTLVVIVSKTFTTAETMLNARTLRKWLIDHVGASASDVVKQHVIAVSAAVPKAVDFGIDANNVFGFWDWVGGRYSVCSAVGLMPLALQYGYGPVQAFLDGAHSMDEHFFNTPVAKNLPVLLGLLGVWNSTFLGYATRALLPYSQALLRFPAHIQQVDMESNGKGVALTGERLPFEAGEIGFGEPGTNGQHSFYQLIHQGRVIPCDFVGVSKSQTPMSVAGEEVSNHDELMSNFFAQPDALAYGKSAAEVEAEGNPVWLVPHKVFLGNRPSSSILFPNLDAYRVGQLLALYEHRTAVQGFVWNIPSFDQWGVELGKVLAKKVRTGLAAQRKSGATAAPAGFNPSTSKLLARYLEQSS